MQQGYEIRRLPLKAIKKDDKGMYYIEGGTFPHIPMNLPIRERAVRFAQNWFDNETRYICLYADEKGITPLFVILQKINEKQYFVCRCTGKTVVNRHWGRLEEELEFVKENYIREFLSDKMFFDGYYAFGTKEK